MNRLAIPQEAPGFLGMDTYFDERADAGRFNLARADERMIKEELASVDAVKPTTWATFERLLEERIGSTRYDMWFRGSTQFALEGSELRIGVPNRFYLDWLESHYQVEIATVATAHFGRPTRVRFAIAPELFQDQLRRQRDQKSRRRAAAGLPTDPADAATEGTASAEATPSADPASRNGRHAPRPAPVPSPASTAPVRSPARRPAVSERFALQRFLPSGNSRIAHAAILSLADNPLDGYSPIVLHGGGGVGKTHLLTGLAHEVRRRHPRLRVLHLAAEEFTNRFVEAMQKQQSAAFRQEFRSVNLLLIDDIQFLARKRSTQAELVHTLDALSRRGGRAVLACDLPPNRIDGIAPDLASRLAAGMPIRMEPPDRDTRLALLVQWAQQRGLVLDAPVLEFLAQSLPSNVAEMEGAINYLEHYADTIRQPLDLPVVRQALGDVLRQSVPVLTVDQVQKLACDLFAINPRHLKARSRARAVSHPRMLVLYLARRYTSATYQEIGAKIGGLNHSTVIAAERKILADLESDGAIVLRQQTWKIRDAIEHFERELGC